MSQGGPMSGFGGGHHSSMGFQGSQDEGSMFDDPPEGDEMQGDPEDDPMMDPNGDGEEFGPWSGGSRGRSAGGPPGRGGSSIRGSKMRGGSRGGPPGRGASTFGSRGSSAMGSRGGPFGSRGGGSGMSRGGGSRGGTIGRGGSRAGGSSASRGGSVARGMTKSSGMVSESAGQGSRVSKEDPVFGRTAENSNDDPQGESMLGSTKGKQPSKNDPRISGISGEYAT